MPNLQAENDAGYGIRFRFPARVLTRGQYQVRLSGIDADGGAATTEEYAFIVED